MQTDKKLNISVCMGSSCFTRGNSENLKAIEDFIEKYNLQAKVEITGSLCREKCTTGPNIWINEEYYSNVSADTVNDILMHYLQEAGK